MAKRAAEAGPSKWPQHGYVDRYCAFIDILGFRGLIGGLTPDGNSFLALRGALSKIHAPVSRSAVNWHTDFRAQSISDAVAISTLATDNGLLLLLSAIEELAIELLKDGYFIRGALVRGKLYHDANMVFGQALVRAYELESTVVKFPRVMITRDILDDIERFSRGFFVERKKAYEPFIEQADDGPYFVHVLKGVAAKIHQVQVENLNKRPEDKQPLDEYARMQDMIQKRLDEATDNPRHFENVRWFALYWRKHMPYGVTGFKGITGPGMD